MINADGLHRFEDQCRRAIDRLSDHPKAVVPFPVCETDQDEAELQIVLHDWMKTNYPHVTATERGYYIIFEKREKREKARA
jgi:hypothetical protein